MHPFLFKNSVLGKLWLRSSLKGKLIQYFYLELN